MAAAPCICAIATPPAAGGIGILRVSGDGALAVVAALAPGLPSVPQPRHAYVTALRDRAGGLLDEGLALYFQGPHSFTGEDVVELHAHGSPRLLRLLQAEVLADPRVRLAEPGEFTRRAFLNGRIDLARAEAVADLVGAESEAAVRAAAAQVTGALSERLRGLRDPLRALHADVEGVLAFPDEAEGADAEVAARVEALHRSAGELLAEAARGQLVRRFARVVLFGPVNAGKSTLFNRLLGEERALVDEAPGTTRDLLEARLELDGLGVTLIDTAGLREAPGRVEALGIERARSALRGADLAVLLVPPDASAAEVDAWRSEAEGVTLLVVRGRADEFSSDGDPRVSGKTRAAARRADEHAGNGGLRVSGKTGAGLVELRRAVMTALWGAGTPQAVAALSERQAQALARAVASLDQARTAATVSTLEVVAGELGLALGALGELTGEDASEALLDEIFRRFCIGK